MKRRTRRPISCLFIAAFAWGLGTQGCAHGVGVSKSPAVPWTPPAELQAPKALPATTPSIPKELQSGQGWTLGDLVDIALRNSSRTREAWDNARAAAAAFHSDQGAWFPQLSATANVTRQKSGGFNGRPSFEQTTYGGTINLDFLIFNFGGRRATIEESRQALIASDWTHNQAIQDAILDVIQAYFGYVTAESLSASQEATLHEARTNLDAAQARHDAGIATIADVLQARTAVAQAQLILDGFQGQIETTRGALATAMGLPATTSFNVAIDQALPPVKEAGRAVEEYLAEAMASRPDLAAARAEADQAAAHTKVIKAEGYPSITAFGNLGRTYLESTDTQANTYLGVIQAQMPLFTGFSHHYDVKEAKARTEAAQARLAGLEQQVVLDVWTSYYNLRTAQQRLLTSEDLLRSATENHAVATGRYTSGVGSFLDLLAAQSALASARATGALARADWYVTLAQLAHATGTLSPALGSAADSTGRTTKP